MKEDKNLPATKNRTVLFASHQYDLLFRKRLSETVSETLSVSDEVYRESEIVVSKIIENIRPRLKNSRNINEGVSKVDGNLSLKVFERCSIDIVYSVFIFANQDLFQNRENLDVPEPFASTEIGEDGSFNMFKININIYIINGFFFLSNLFSNIHHEMNHVYKMFKMCKGFSYKFNMYPIASKILDKKLSRDDKKNSKDPKTIESQISDAITNMVHFAEQFEIDAEVQAVYREFMGQKGRTISTIEKYLPTVNDKRKYMEDFLISFLTERAFYKEFLVFEQNISLISQNRKLADKVLKLEYPRKKTSNDENSDGFTSNNLTVGTFLKYCMNQRNYFQRKINNLLKRIYITLACTDRLKNVLTFGMFGMNDNELTNFKKTYKLT